jgi:phage tail-like protein
VIRRDDWLVSQLPAGMLEDRFFVRLAALFQELATSLVEDADNVANAIDATVAPPEFVRWLDSWIGLEPLDSALPEPVQRRMVRQGGQNLAWRGTHRALKDTLELVTGGPVTIEDSGGIGRAGTIGERSPFVRVQVTSTGWMSESGLVAAVSDHIPVSVDFEVWLEHRLLWPPPVSDDPVVVAYEPVWGEPVR